MPWRRFATPREVLRFVFSSRKPGVFTDPRFREVFTAEALGPYGVEPERCCLEITEHPVADYCELERLWPVSASEDFPSPSTISARGIPGLRTLSICAPDFLKLDMAPSRGFRWIPTRDMWYRFGVIRLGGRRQDHRRGSGNLGGSENPSGAWSASRPRVLVRAARPGLPEPAPYVLERWRFCGGLSARDCIVGEGLRSLVIRPHNG